MKHCLAGLVFMVLLLVLSGIPAGCEETGQAPPLQLQQAPAQNSRQVEEIRDIKGPVPLAALPGYLIPALVVFGLVLLAALFFYFLKRRRRPQIVVPPPEITALAELDRAQSLRGQPLVYAERISAILRQYIESRFQIRSTRQTTREFFTGLQSGILNTAMPSINQANDLKECMEHCDMAKFAHGRPDQERMQAMDQAVRNFIETTRSQETA